MMGMMQQQQGGLVACKDSSPTTGQQGQQGQQGGQHRVERVICRLVLGWLAWRIGVRASEEGKRGTIDCSGNCIVGALSANVIVRLCEIDV